MSLCNLYNRLLITSLASTLQKCYGISVTSVVHGQRGQYCSTAESSSNSSSNGSSSSSKNDSGAGDALTEFHQKVAAVQSHQGAPDLQRWRDAAAAAPPSPAPVAMAKYDSSSNKSPTDEGSTSANSLVSPRYGYAVLGGVNPEASQKEAGAQQPKLHPTRDFRQGDLYQSQDLSPLSRDESDELWLQKRRRGRQHHRVPVEEVKKQLDFKNVDFLLNFVSESGRIKPKWETGLKPVLQAKVAKTVKLARQMALLPYDMRLGDGSGEGDMWRRMRQYEAAQRAAAGGSTDS